MRVIASYTWLYLLLTISLTGCTISFSNVSTHGTASDVIDDTQDASPTVSTTATIPLK